MRAQRICSRRSSTSWLPGLANLDPRFRSPAWDPRARMGRAVHVERHRHRLQPQPSGPLPRAGPTSGIPRSKAASRCSTIPRTCWARASRSSASPSAPPTPPNSPAPDAEAIAQKPLLRAYLNAEVRDQLVSGDVLAAQLWSTTAPQAMDAAPHLAFVYPAEGFPLLLRLRRHPAREPPPARSRTSSSITCCAPRSPPRSSTPPRPRPPTPPRATFCPRRSAITPRSIRRPMSSSAASGRGRSRPPASACATASGRRSSRRSATVCGPRPAAPSRPPPAARDPTAPPASGWPGLLLQGALPLAYGWSCEGSRRTRRVCWPSADAPGRTPAGRSWPPASNAFPAASGRPARSEMRARFVSVMAPSCEHPSPIAIADCSR